MFGSPILAIISTTSPRAAAMAAGAVFAVVATGERRLEGRQENAWAQVGVRMRGGARAWRPCAGCGCVRRLASHVELWSSDLI